MSASLSFSVALGDHRRPSLTRRWRRTVDRPDGTVRPDWGRRSSPCGGSTVGRCRAPRRWPAPAVRWRGGRAPEGGAAGGAAVHRSGAATPAAPARPAAPRASGRGARRDGAVAAPTGRRTRGDRSVRRRAPEHVGLEGRAGVAGRSLPRHRALHQEHGAIGDGEHPVHLLLDDQQRAALSWMATSPS